MTNILVYKVGIFLFVGIYSIPTSVNGESILFPGGDSLFNQLNITEDEISTRAFNFPNSNDDSCRTPEGNIGECIGLNQCPELMNYIKNNGLQRHHNIRFLRSRICKFLVRNVQLCCVKENAPVQTIPAIIPSIEDCGLSDGNRITGDAIELPHGSHPWLVALGFPRTDDTFTSICGGTLITKRHVLTAAHCFDTSQGNIPPTHVRVGDHSLSRKNESLPPITLAIADRKSPTPKYNTDTQLNDIELLTLEKDVNFTIFIQPACLPFNFRDVNFDQKLMSIMGWGELAYRSGISSDVPLFANVTGVPKAECRKSYAGFPKIPLDKTQFCAGTGGEDTCRGDSGGPLLYLDLEKELRYFVMGIVSFGVRCGDASFPGVYTFVPEFTDWIVSNIQQ